VTTGATLFCIGAGIFIATLPISAPIALAVGIIAGTLITLGSDWTKEKWIGH